MNYPVLRQNKRVLLNTFVKNHCLKSHHCTLIQEARRDRQMECTQRSNRDCGFLRTYTIIHAYFALVQGSSYYVSSPSFFYPPCFMLSLLMYIQCCIFRPWCFSNVFNNTPLFSTGQFDSHSSPSILYPPCYKCLR